MNQNWVQDNYFEIGTQYYVVGRFAVLGRLAPVCGNLLHHAIEMYLKGFLCAELSENQLKGLSHNLDKAWRRFKHKVKDPSLDRFDDVVSELDRFEKIRYPEKMIYEGAQMFIGRGTVNPVRLGSGSKKVPSYRVSLGLIDELVKCIFTVSKMNLEGFVKIFTKEAQGFLRRENVHSI